MNELDVFVSVGGTATEQQETFVRAVEDRLRSEGLVPHTVGRNTFSADTPLKTITDLLSRCSGTVVIALERSYFASGIEKRGGPKETACRYQAAHPMESYRGGHGLRPRPAADGHRRGWSQERRAA